MPTERITKQSQVPSKYLPYELPYMTDELRKRAKAELFEDEETRVHSFKLFKSLLDSEKNLDYFDDEMFHMAFLRARKFDVNRAFNLAKTFYTVKNKHKELFNEYNFNDVKRVYSDKTVGFLPHRDDEGCVVLMLHIGIWNPNLNSHCDVMRALTTGLLHAIRSPSTQVTGFKVIVDCKGFTLNSLTHISPTYLWLFAEALQNCFPARFKAVHIVNETHLFSYIWAILKSFLTKKLRERFHFHGKNMNKLHKFFPRAILPKEYGGEQPPYDNADWARSVEKVSDYLTCLHSFGYVKTKKNNYAE